MVGGASFVLYGMIAANGLRALVDGRVNFSDSKNMMVVSITLAVGLGLNAASMAGHSVAIGDVTISPLAIATLLAIILNIVIPNSKTPTEEEESAMENAEVSLVPHEGDALAFEKESENAADNAAGTEDDATDAEDGGSDAKKGGE